MNLIKQKDLIKGSLEEIRIKSIINEYFNCDVNKTDDNHPMDYIDTNTYFEIKSRNNNYKKYPTTMIGKNKVDFANKNPDKTFYFIFSFYDGDYYYKYNKSDKLDFGIGGRNDRGKNEYKQYCYIDISYLSKL